MLVAFKNHIQEPAIGPQVRIQFVEQVRLLPDGALVKRMVLGGLLPEPFPEMAFYLCKVHGYGF